MEKKKIIHLHSDIKFVIPCSKEFENNFCENVIVFFGSKNEYTGPYKEEIRFYNTTKTDIQKVINLCKTADIVVLHALDQVKIFIANRLPKSIITIWRFFGYELYSKIPEYVYSELTLSALAKQHSVYKKFRIIAGKLKFLIKYQTTLKNEFNKGIERINYFACLSEIEYHFLKQYWPNLPVFLQLPTWYHTYHEKDFVQKENKIIVGNNRSAYNNHLDILTLIKNSKNREKYSFLLIFNYGQNNAYSAAVREMAHRIKEVTVLEEFLSFENFENLYKTASAFVLNGYRQMAMQNILEALKNNVKIYLNENNIMLNWLKKEGFLFFTINDFISDLETNNISLSETESQHNQRQLNIFVKKHTQEEFNNLLLKIVSKTEN
jgi:hypothetical protein